MMIYVACSAWVYAGPHPRDKSLLSQSCHSFKAVIYSVCDVSLGFGVDVHK